MEGEGEGKRFVEKGGCGGGYEEVLPANSRSWGRIGTNYPRSCAIIAAANKILRPDFLLTFDPDFRGARSHGLR